MSRLTEARLTVPEAAFVVGRGAGDDQVFAFARPASESPVLRVTVIAALLARSHSGVVAYREQEISALRNPARDLEGSRSDAAVGRRDDDLLRVNPRRPVSRQ